MDLASGKESKLAENAFDPAYSPDGRRLAVDASWAGPRRIWLLDREGHNPQQITTDTSEEPDHIGPAWSPDGKKIVFQNIVRTQFNVRVVKLDSKQMNWITNDFRINIRPSWSPSGRFIYFSSDRSGGININGKPEKVYEFPDSDVRIDYPVWSPDGKWVLFDRFRPQGDDIWVMSGVE